MALSEHAIQSAYFDWAKLHSEACRAFAIPNGGYRQVVTASKLKKEGVRKGVLDLCLPLARSGCHGLWIEFKANSKNLTTEQSEEAHQLVKDGFCVVVAWDTIAAIEATKEYLADKLSPGLYRLKAPRLARPRSTRTRG